MNSQTIKALGEIKQTSSWHPTVHALTGDAGRPLQYTKRAGQQSCRHGKGGWRGLSAGLVSRWPPRSIVKYILHHVKPALEGIVWDVSKERNLKYCLPPSANRPQALTVFLTARKDLRAGKKRVSFWKLTSTFFVEATLQLASRPEGLFSFGSPGMLTRLHKWFVPRMLCDPHAVQTAIANLSRQPCARDCESICRSASISLRGVFPK